MLSTVFIYGGINSLRNADAVAARSQQATGKLVGLINDGTSLPIKLNETMLVRADAALKTVAGLALATNRQPRLAALTLAASLAPTTIAGHPFWQEDDPAKKANETRHFVKNLSLLGALMLASVDTAGKPSVAWRVRRQARKLGEHVPTP
jgi:putative oxidoreductase